MPTTVCTSDIPSVTTDNVISTDNVIGVIAVNVITTTIQWPLSFYKTSIRVVQGEGSYRGVKTSTVSVY